MANDRLKSEAAREAVEHRLAPSTPHQRRDEDVPPVSHRRLLGWLGGDVACALCARRAQGGSATLDLARTSCQFLAATWVVLTLGDS